MVFTKARAARVTEEARKVNERVWQEKNVNQREQTVIYIHTHTRGVCICVRERENQCSARAIVYNPTYLHDALVVYQLKCAEQEALWLTTTSLSKRSCNKLIFLFSSSL